MEKISSFIDAFIEKQNIDYKQLLIKYIANVIDCEGVDFVGSIHAYNIDFTKEEISELQKLSTEADKLL